MKLKSRTLLLGLLVLSALILALSLYYIKIVNVNESLQNDYQSLLQTSQLIITEEFKINSQIDKMFFINKLNVKDIYKSIELIEKNINKINHIIDEEKISRAYKIIDFLGFKSELYTSLKMQKKQFSIIDNNFNKTININSEVRNAVEKFHQYKLQPILVEITLLYSQNFKVVMNENKTAIYTLGSLIFILFIALIIMTYKLNQFNVVLDKKVKQRTKKLKEQSNKVEQLINLNSLLIKHTPEGIIGLDSRGFVTFLNPSALNSLSVNEVSVYGFHISQLIETFDYSNKPISLQQVDLKVYFKNRDVIKVNNGLFKLIKSNETLNVDFEITYYNNKDYHAEGYIINFRDVSRRQALENELNQERAMSAHASKLASLGEMAGGIAHEINTPLGVIMLSNEEIETELLSENMDLKYVLSLSETIKTTTLKVSKIVKALRSLSHVSGDDDRSFNKVDSIIDNVLTLANEKIKINSIDVSYVNSLSPNYELYCDQVQISQVILNFVSNSLDAIENLNDKWIKIEISETDEFVVLSITDSGRGIPEESLGKIFQPFFTTKPVGKGTGLGMPISKAIIVKHGGDIKYDKSSINTKFDLLLPKFSNSNVQAA